MTSSSFYGTQGFHDSNGDYTKETPLEDHSLPLYQFQKDLPRLPVPPLQETCEKYLRSVKPLMSEVEFAKTIGAVNDFVAQGGIGHELQRRLLNLKEEKQNTSWLAEWWNSNGYLRVRCPNVFYVSYFFHFTDSPLAWMRTQTGRAAMLLSSSIAYRDRVVSGQLPQTKLGKTPLDSTPFKYMFNSCRIPRYEADVYRLYDPAANNHVAVVCHNKFFTFDVKLGGETLSLGDLKRQLDAVVAQAGSKETAVGVLSSQNRDVWAADRATLLSAGNEASLRRVESALLLICLDDRSPHSREDMARTLWHGDGHNRFYDKTLQLVVCANGKAGLMAEHSMSDGMAVSLYANWLMQMQKAAAQQGAPAPVASGRALPVPAKVEFKLTPQLLRACDRAADDFRAEVDAHDVRVLHFTGFGKRAVKTFGISPDAFAQMAIQLANYKLFGELRATYEASQVHPFLHGRTEVTRSVSNESKAFVQAMADQPGVPTVRKLELLKAAAAAHVGYLKAAAKGMGVDRHLLGLKLRLRPGESSALFDDAAYARSSNWRISTSTLSNDMFDGWGWGEVVPDGVGVAYSVKSDTMQFNVASLRHPRQVSWPGAMTHYLEEALLEMKQLFDLKPQSKL